MNPEPLADLESRPERQYRMAHVMVGIRPADTCDWDLCQAMCQALVRMILP